MDINFNRRIPHILVVDNFYKYPDDVVRLANTAQYYTDDNCFKGSRSEYKFLFPYVKEEFERLLNAKITDWITQPMNGVFQKTLASDPLVWHSDTQDYAAAIYLTKDADNMGTSFWRDKKYRCRRPPNHMLENKPVELCNEIYSDYNLLHADNWELVDKVGAVFNRLVIWDAKLIHSASQYGNKDRLVQLFFFSVNN